MDKKLAIKYFNQVRDIPYSIPTTVKEVDHCCSGKHILLKNYLEKLGYQTQFRVCTFKWSSLSLPKNIISISHNDNSTHVYLEVKIDKEWEIIDATWDKKLSPVFHINEWDGKTDTQIAVLVIKTFSIEESNKIMTSEDKETIEADLKINGKFYKGFNNWLDSIRF